jgi:hypothetical protein
MVTPDRTGVKALLTETMRRQTLKTRKGEKTKGQVEAGILEHQTHIGRKGGGKNLVPILDPGEGKLTVTCYRDFAIVRIGIMLCPVRLYCAFNTSLLFLQVLLQYLEILSEILRGLQNFNYLYYCTDFKP